MPEAFTGVRLKLSRAFTEINALNADIDRYLNSPTPPVKIVMDFDQATRVFEFKLLIARSPDPMWGVRIGEVVHNLRSALDHIVWELVILATGRPPAPGSKNQFPIFDTLDGFKRRGVDPFLRCVHIDAVNLVRSEQPFLQKEPHKSPLWHLHELSNADKHRTLCVVYAFPQMFGISKFPTCIEPDAYLEDLQHSRPPGPIGHGAVLFRGRVIGSALANPFSSQPSEAIVAPNVAFDQATPSLGGWVVIAALQKIQSNVEEVAGRIAKDIFNVELGPIPIG